MKFWSSTALIAFIMLYQGSAFSQPLKLNKEQKKQERNRIDSLFIVYSLPVSVSLETGYFNEELKDTLIKVLEKKNFDLASTEKTEKLMKENLFSFLPNPVTERERYREVMEKVAKDQSYYFRLAEMEDPFLQKVILFSKKEEDSESFFIVIKRQNYPNVKKSREWTFKYDASEPIGTFATRIVDTLTNKIIAQ